MLSYSVTGSKQLPPLVFLHGFLGVKEDWEEVISSLQDQFCCYTIDLPGHGSSPYEDHLLESIFNTLQSLDLFPAPIVGYSMGGRLALFLKEYFPKLFKELILIGAHTGIEDEQERKSRWHKDLNWSLILDTQPFESFLLSWYSQPLFQSLKKRPEVFAKILTRRTHQNPQNMASILRNFSLGLQPPLKKFHQDTLFIYGEEDPMFSELYQDFSPSDLTIEKIKGGHALHLENPHELADKIVNFLAKIRSPV